MFVFHTASIWITPDAEVLTDQNTSAETMLFDLDTITSRDLFTNNKTTSQTVATRSQTIESQNNTYLLQAVFESSEPGESRAIISSTGSTPRSYTQGEEITSGVSVYRIERNRVLLSTPRGTEALGFRAPTLASTGPAIQRSIDFEHSNVDKQVGIGPGEASQGQLSPSKLDSVRNRLQQLRDQSRSQ